MRSLRTKTDSPDDLEEFDSPSALVPLPLPDAAATARYIDETFGPDLADALGDDDVTANRIAHDFLWRHGPIPWAEFEGRRASQSSLEAFYAGDMLGLICELGAEEFLLRVPSFREMALIEMANALNATELDSPPS